VRACAGSCPTEASIERLTGNIALASLCVSHRGEQSAVRIDDALLGVLRCREVDGAVPGKTPGGRSSSRVPFTSFHGTRSPGSARDRSATLANPQPSTGAILQAVDRMGNPGHARLVLVFGNRHGAGRVRPG
jgi:hypothetical protein